MPGHNYPTVAEVLEIHRQLIAEFGGAPGLVDLGRLEAAIFRPQIGYYNDLVEEAAALAESLGNNNPFVDGNKRVAFFVTDTFLRMNGFCLAVEALETYRFITGAMSEGKFRFGVLCNWIRSHLRPLSKG